MASFDPAIQVVLGHEGVTGNLRGDPGGETCYGWSATECQALGVAQPQTPEQAEQLYVKVFWNPRYNLINSQNVATKILDDCVNQGTPVGIKHLQEALTKAGSVVDADGIFGPATLTATNFAPEQLLLPWFRLIQWESYKDWIKKDPARAGLTHGLANRAAWPDPDGSIAAQLMAATYQAGG